MERMSCDLVVIGSGGAGMVAAGHAAVLGAKVIVLEKNKLIGGNTWFAVGTRYINSRRGRENGMGDLRDTLFRECMAKTNWRKDPKTVHRFLDEYEKVYDWLDEVQSWNTCWKSADSMMCRDWPVTGQQTSGWIMPEQSAV